MRPPVNLSRLRYHRDSQLLRYEPKAGPEVDDEALVDPLWPACSSTSPSPTSTWSISTGAYANRVRFTYRREDSAPTEQDIELAPAKRTLSKRWAELIYRIYDVDPLNCLNCGAKMKILAFIIDPAVVRRILDHLDKASRQRAPPGSTPIH